MTLTYERLKHDITNKYCFVGQFSGDDRLPNFKEGFGMVLKMRK